MLGIPSLFNTVAFTAIVSISVVAVYIAYVLPTFTRLISRDFHPGPWNLGRWSRPVGWTAVGWVGFITILFVLPSAWPITWANFNYTIVAVGVVVLAAWLWWALSAKHWFTGPRHNVDEPVERTEVAG